MNFLCRFATNVFITYGDIGKVLGVQPQMPEGYKGYVFGRIYGCSNGSFK